MRGNRAINALVEHPGTGQEPDPEWSLEGEATAATGHHVDQQLGVLPYLVLLPSYIEGRALQLAQQDIPLAHSKLSPRKAHRGTAVTAAARLVEQKGTVLRLQLAQHGRGRIGNGHAGYAVDQKNPSFFGL